MKSSHSLSPDYLLVAAFLTGKAGYFPVIILEIKPFYPRVFPIASRLDARYYAIGLILKGF
jgi:hypothetical protein